ncbi:MAG: DUF1015 domain-containing protein, partial [Sedimentisphaerales bacterium]|nr:DUF1015 domain-containing protein [Sedimentisphaerales bacterium]
MNGTVREKSEAAMNVTPFKGWRYDSSVVGEAGLCIAPPYDVIDAESRKKLCRRSEYNIVRITKGNRESGDGETENVYTRAAATLDKLVESGALKQDEQESIYVYAQDYTIGDRDYRRTGFIGLGELAEYGGAVRPHEHTLTGPKEDRLSLMRATNSQTGQIFMLYDDTEKTIDAILAQACEQKELLNSTDDEQVRHRLFAITDQGQIETIRQVMSDKTIFIADGHHRYETALNYYRETKNPAAGYCMMTFVNTHNEGLTILPTHRLIKNVADFDHNKLLSRLNEHFDMARLAYNDVVEKTNKRQMMLDALKLEFENGEHGFGMYFNDGAFYVATLRDMNVMDNLAANQSPAWRRLDVAILHKLILEKMLRIDDADLSAQSHVEYIKDFGPATLRAIDKVDDGEGQGLFFLNPPHPEEVEAVAQAGEKMPQKSTFFYPKI